MDTSGQQDANDSSSLTNNEANESTVQDAQQLTEGNLFPLIRREIAQTQRQIESMKTEPNEAPQQSSAIYGYIAPQPEAEVSAGK